jgi:hypothetical protein
MLLTHNPNATKDVPNDWDKFQGLRYAI